jgi:hypothetical protein
MSKKEKTKPYILILDIETSPILGWVWGLWENNLSLSQVEKDWEILSFSAKWYQNMTTKEVYGPHNKVIYMDQRNNKEIINDKKMLLELWNLINESDIVLTQNGVSFDNKKINAKFIQAGMAPPSPSKQIDTKRLASKLFAFTSKKLEYMGDLLNEKYTKMKNSGFTLWTRCMKGELKAWKEMERYNKYDILSLQELYNKMAPWDTSIDFNLYNNNIETACNCGSYSLQKRGHSITTTGKFVRYQCTDCGRWSRGKDNLFIKEKRASLNRKV